MVKSFVKTYIYNMENDFLKAMLEQLKDGIVIFNKNGIILKWNKALEKLTGVNRSQAIGENVTDFKDFLFTENLDPREKKDFPPEGFVYCYEITNTSGQIFSVENKLSIIDTEKDYFFLAIIRDISRERNCLSRLTQQKNHIMDAASLAGIGIWEWDFATDKTVWSDKMFEIYGLKKEEFTGKVEDYLLLTHPEDQIHQHEELQKYFDTTEFMTVEEKSNLHIRPSATKYRIIRKNGEIRYLEGDAIPIFDTSGNMTGLVGMVRDKTPEER